MSIKKNSLKLSVIISYIHLFVSIVGSFFITPILLNYIGDTQYGLLSFCNAITTWLSVITTAIGSSYVYFAKKESLDCRDAKKSNTIYFKLFALFAIAITVLMASILLSLYFCGITFGNYSPEESNLIYLLLALSTGQVCFTILFSVYNVFLIADKRFIFIRLRQLIILVCVYAANLLFAMLTGSIVSIAIVSLVSCILNNLIAVFYSLKIRKMKFGSVKLNESSAFVKSIFVYSSFVLVNTAISTMNNSMDKILLGFISTPANVTLYSLAFSFTLYLTTLIGAISESFMPRIHELYDQEKYDEANHLFLKISKLQSIIIVFVTFGFLACGNEFVFLWLGESRIQVYGFATVLNILTIVPLTTTTCIDCERAQNRHKFRAIIYFASAVFNIALSITLLFTLKDISPIWCCIIGTVASRVIAEWIIMPIYDKKVINLGMGHYFLTLLKIALFGGVAVGITLLFRFLAKQTLNNIALLFLEGLIFVIIFVLFMIIFERKFIREIVPSLKGRKTKNG